MQEKFCRLLFYNYNMSKGVNIVLDWKGGYGAYWFYSVMKVKLINT